MLNTGKEWKYYILLKANHLADLIL